jgi:hypothetical protein
MAMTPIFHISHISNLAGIVGAGCLWSDARRRRHKFACTNVGHEHIKLRRMQRPVPVVAGGMLGEYVPVNFCPRSVMLYVISRNGVAGYSGGQMPVVHLVSSIETAVAVGHPWAFTDIHAKLAYARYFDNLAHLDEIDWSVMPLRDWRGEERKKRRQAEFLVHDWFPWHCVERIGVYNPAMAAQVEQICSAAAHRPVVEVRTQWYY